MKPTYLITDAELLERIGGVWPAPLPPQNKVVRLGNALRVTEPATRHRPERTFIVRITDDGGVVEG